ncbi:hypothetical protein [Gluconobacter albidus]|uniref:hypothetical protein n=1 Tax=Gluconobacter albidus TaxID=318683 RepID=UPI000ADF3AC2|nr:hypothetical protein [Gluconobacter albidus]
MSEDDNDTAPKKTVEELQLDIAKIAFEIAKVSAALKNHFDPRINILSTPDPADLYNQLNSSYEKMMDLCGDLIGVHD